MICHFAVSNLPIWTNSIHIQLLALQRDWTRTGRWNRMVFWILCPL